MQYIYYIYIYCKIDSARQWLSTNILAYNLVPPEGHVCQIVLQTGDVIQLPHDRWLSSSPLPVYNNDVIKSAMTSQITSLTIVYSTVNSGADKRKYQSSVSLAFVRGNISIWWRHHEILLFGVFRETSYFAFDNRHLYGIRGEPSFWTPTTYIVYNSNLFTMFVVY